VCAICARSVNAQCYVLEQVDCCSRPAFTVTGVQCSLESCTWQEVPGFAAWSGNAKTCRPSGSPATGKTSYSTSQQPQGCAYNKAKDCDNNGYCIWDTKIYYGACYDDNLSGSTCTPPTCP